ncbi:bifunctional DNA-formamidopyrimidine glycosylase/DNA-(apurinic or apyrimidinic site) lyase [Schlesneria sp. DSM 10557]|uniref:bifunctional DNA-formamidopyrimidine glycosylase/DNA-(apurinic or apyrimidinic site) lyase n=1 Tax=Schlesneria sp. DSM 10557 TaxID=3044399 RepID=UPI0035A125CA
MPELPEVETMVRGIRPQIVGRTICDLSECENGCKPILITPKFTQLRKRLVGKQFASVRRVGKRVVFDVSDGTIVAVEPRMTGLMVLADPPDVSHLRLRWDFEGDDQYPSLWFWDRRGLGTVSHYLPGEFEERYGPKCLGPDALEMTLEMWRERCAASNREIKVLLLDQKRVAGIGNLYASEILHVAGIHPSAPAKMLNPRQVERLAAAAQEVLLKAIECEGSTLSDGTYRNALNQNGSYQNLHRAYMRAGSPCLSCGSEAIQRIVQAQRSTFYCPECQKMKTSSRKGSVK